MTTPKTEDAELILNTAHLTPPILPAERLPKHVGIQPDGNGRWAVARGLPRTQGHEAGGDALLDVIEGAVQLGIPFLSLHAFSTENWKRSPQEVAFLLEYLAGFLVNNRDQFNSWGVRVRWFGQRSHLPESLLTVLHETENLTVANSGLSLQFCLNYGGRAEIADAAKAIALAVAAGELDPEAVDEHTVAQYISDPDIPDVDLFLRSSGEQRISNFMLWRIAYAEMLFFDALWPDIDRRDLFRAVEQYAMRERRRGGVPLPPS